MNSSHCWTNFSNVTFILITQIRNLYVTYNNLINKDATYCLVNKILCLSMECELLSFSVTSCVNELLLITQQHFQGEKIKQILYIANSNSIIVFHLASNVHFLCLFGLIPQAFLPCTHSCITKQINFCKIHNKIFNKKCLQRKLLLIPINFIELDPACTSGRWPVKIKYNSCKIY